VEHKQKVIAVYSKSEHQRSAAKQQGSDPSGQKESHRRVSTEGRFKELGEGGFREASLQTRLPLGRGEVAASRDDCYESNVWQTVLGSGTLRPPSGPTEADEETIKGKESYAGQVFTKGALKKSERSGAPNESSSWGTGGPNGNSTVKRKTG